MSQPSNQNSVGRLSKNAISDSLVEKTIEFIWSSLIPWKNDPTRPFTDSEEELNAQFHNYLQARASKEFPMVFFQHEQRQEGRRRVDLSAKSTEMTIIRGVAYSIYEPIIVIEGKRLPAPSAPRKFEYITGGHKTSGGIQRFKLGLHGKKHETVIIIGYVQKEDPPFWLKTINDWINELSASTPESWQESECLVGFQTINSNQCSRSNSVHPRVDSCKTKSVKINHFWIDLIRTSN